MKSKFLILLLSCGAHAFTDDEEIIRKKIIQHFPLIEEQIFKQKAASSDVTSFSGEFDHKLKAKTRNNVEKKYDNQFFDVSIERRTPFNGIELFAGHRQGAGIFPSYEGKFETSNVGELYAGLSVPLLRDRKTDEFRNNLNVGRLELEINQWEVLLKKNIYVHKAFILYYKLLLQNKIIQTRERILQLANERQTMIEKMFKAGDTEKMKISDNLRSIDKRKDELLKAKIERDKVMTEWNIITSEADIPSDLLLKDLYDFRNKRENFSEIFNLDELPPIKILDIENQKLTLFQSLYDQMTLPDLSLSLSGSRELSQRTQLDQDALQVGVKFDYPLENRKARGGRDSYIYKIKAIQQRKIYLARELQALITFNLNAYKQSLERIETIDRERKNATLVADAEQTRWKQGQADLFTVNLREQDVAETEIRLWNSIYEMKQYFFDHQLMTARFHL